MTPVAGAGGIHQDPIVRSAVPERGGITDVRRNEPALSGPGAAGSPPRDPGAPASMSTAVSSSAPATLSSRCWPCCPGRHRHRAPACPAGPAAASEPVAHRRPAPIPSPSLKPRQRRHGDRPLQHQRRRASPGGSPVHDAPCQSGGRQVRQVIGGGAALQIQAQHHGRMRVVGLQDLLALLRPVAGQHLHQPPRVRGTGRRIGIGMRQQRLLLPDEAPQDGVDQSGARGAARVSASHPRPDSRRAPERRGNIRSGGRPSTSSAWMSRASCARPGEQRFDGGAQAQIPADRAERDRPGRRGAGHSASEASQRLVGRSARGPRRRRRGPPRRGPAPGFSGAAAQAAPPRTIERCQRPRSPGEQRGRQRADLRDAATASRSRQPSPHCTRMYPSA